MCCFDEFLEDAATHDASQAGAAVRADDEKVEVG